MSAAPIRVFIVEDSAVSRELLIHIFESDPNMEVVGFAASGEDALVGIPDRKPDVITMDIHMPKMDGFETARRIMETEPTPIVIVTASTSHANVEMTFRTLQAGAVAITRKPVGIGGAGHQEEARKLLQIVRLMSEVKVVKRWARTLRERTPDAVPEVRTSAEIKVVAVGASTGGPVVLHTILEKLPKDFGIPILIVQHIAAGFVHGMAEWLARDSGLRVRIAAHWERIVPGNAYIAPDGYHMGVEREGRIVLTADAADCDLCPSVAHLFRSVAEVYGENAAGVLLTGMGRDGAKELGLMRQRGAITFAQDKETSAIFGMPGEAVKLGAAAFVLPPTAIAEALSRLSKKTKGAAA
jgi:two-component system chemotaxis response regulator CheB